MVCSLQPVHPYSVTVEIACDFRFRTRHRLEHETYAPDTTQLEQENAQINLLIVLVTHSRISSTPKFRKNTHGLC